MQASIVTPHNDVPAIAPTPALRPTAIVLQGNTAGATKAPPTPPARAPRHMQP